MKILGPVAIMLLFAPLAVAQDATSVARGRDYANAACSDCHAVSADQRASPNPRAPSFEAIANTPGMTGIALSAWLHTSHPTMPNLIVKADRTDELAAYILALRKKN